MGTADWMSRRASPAAGRLVALALLSALAAGAGAALWSAGRQDEHIATAVVLLHPLAGNAYSPGGRGDELVNLETEAEVLRSEAVARGVLEELQVSGDPQDLLASISVSVPANTQLLQISASGEDDAAAIARASAFASVYLEFRRGRTASAVFEQTSRIEELIDARTAERNLAIRQLAGATSAERPVLAQQIEELTVQISSLRAQLVTAEAEPRDAGQVVSTGRIRDPGKLADPAVTGGLAGAAVLVAAFTLLVARSARTRLGTVTSLDDLADLAPPVLGAGSAPVRADADLVAAVRSAVLSGAASRPRVVVVARADCGRQNLHEPLVAALVNARYQVVSVDLGRPQQVAALRQLVLDDAAVDDVLVERRPLMSSLQPMGGEVDAGTPALADLASSAGMITSLHELAKRADVVLVACAGLGTTTGRALLAAASGVVVEVGERQTTHADVEAAVQQAELAGCQVLGLALVRPTGHDHEASPS